MNPLTFPRNHAAQGAEQQVKWCEMPRQRGNAPGPTQEVLAPVPYKDRTQQRRAQREWVARRRAEFFADKECEVCGSASELRLHHRDPNAKASHRIWSWSPDRRDAEIAKCRIVCEPCHRRMHAEARLVEAQLRHPCGTYAAYKRGCKCDACRAANCDYQRALKERAA